MSLKRIYLNLLGLLALPVFSIFVFTSFALYPTPYTPLYDWLSNLGNAALNPSGAVFFNIGCIITGIILLPFLVNLYRWNPPERPNKILLTASIFLGVLAAISLMGVGFFPETHIKMHILSASGVFGTMFLIVILLNVALFKHPKFMRPVAYWGIIAVLIDLIFIIILRIPYYHNSLANLHPTIPIPALEWAAVFSSLIWIALLSYNMYRNRV